MNLAALSEAWSTISRISLANHARAKKKGILETTIFACLHRHDIFALTIERWELPILKSEF